MNNEKKFTNKFRIIASIIAIVLAFAVLAGIIYGLTRANRNSANGNFSLETEGGTVINVSCNGVDLKIVRITDEDLEEDAIVDTEGFEDNDVPPTDESEEDELPPKPESTYMLTATVTPSNLRNKKVLWEIEFNNPDSQWATDKNVEDFVKLTVLSEDSAKLECYVPFGEQIMVKAISDQDNSKSALCTIDYKEKVLGYTITLDRIIYDPELESYQYIDGRRIFECRVFPDYVLEYSAGYSFNLITSEAYTIPRDPVTFYCTLNATEELKLAVEEAGFSAENLTDYAFDASDGLTGELEHFFDSVWCDTLNESIQTSARRNALIYMLDEYVESPAYKLTIFDYKGGSEIFSYDIAFDTTIILDQVVVDGVQMNAGSIVF